LTARKLLLEKISILLVTFGLTRPEACPQLDWGARATRIFVFVCQGHPRVVIIVQNQVDIFLPRKKTWQFYAKDLIRV